MTYCCLKFSAFFYIVIIFTTIHFCAYTESNIYISCLCTASIDVTALIQATNSDLNVIGAFVSGMN